MFHILKSNKTQALMSRSKPHLQGDQNTVITEAAASKPGKIQDTVWSISHDVNDKTLYLATS